MRQVSHVSNDWRSLTREEVRAALRFQDPPRPPLANALWANAETRAALGDALVELRRKFPDDVALTGTGTDYWKAPADDPTYRWAFGDKTRPEGVAIDACPVIADWSELDQFLSEFPSSNRPSAVAGTTEARRRHPDRYVPAGWGHYLHQRLAYLRGLERLLMDFYDHPDELRRVMDALMDLHRVWAGDDLGAERSLFMSPDTFRSLYKPYYAQLAECLHENGLDFWLHTCGDNTEIMGDIIQIGVDAIHPIQVGTMDDAQIARDYGRRIAFWIGMDVQQLLPFGATEEVRAGCYERMKTFYRPDGDPILAAGNAIMPETPLENIRAYMESLRAPLAK